LWQGLLDEVHVSGRSAKLGFPWFARRALGETQLLRLSLVITFRLCAIQDRDTSVSDSSSKGRIVRETHRVMDESSEGRIVERRISSWHALDIRRKSHLLSVCHVGGQGKS
jgi:hypothetical protein